MAGQEMMMQHDKGSGRSPNCNATGSTATKPLPACPHGHVPGCRLFPRFLRQMHSLPKCLRWRYRLSSAVSITRAHGDRRESVPLLRLRAHSRAPVGGTGLRRLIIFGLLVASLALTAYEVPFYAHYIRTRNGSLNGIVFDDGTLDTVITAVFF